MNHKKKIIALSFQLLSNLCSMKCVGCGINVAPVRNNKNTHIFDQGFIDNAKENLITIREKMRENNYDFFLVEQTGGEPTQSPQLVELIGEIFPDQTHKIITNGLFTEAINEYLLKRKTEVILFISLDHNRFELNRIRFQLNKASINKHEKILKNLDLFVKQKVPIVIPTIISSYNINYYLEFIEWLERRYPDAIENGNLTPVPISLVSYGNPVTGKLNPTEDQVKRFEDQVHNSQLLTVARTKNWLLKDLIGHYQNKFRHFNYGEPIENIAKHSSKPICNIYNNMVSFNFQDEEILKKVDDALFQGFVCGVKVLGNIGYPLGSFEREKYSFPKMGSVPTNMLKCQKYFSMSQIDEYLTLREKIANNIVPLNSNEYFYQMRQGMCLLDDFDGAWMPFNSWINGNVDLKSLGEFWSFFRQTEVVKKLKELKRTE